MKKLIIAFGLVSVFLALGISADALTPAAVNGCQYNGTPPALTDQQTVVFQCDTSGALIVAGFGGGTLSVNVSELGGNPIDIGVGAAGLGTARIMPANEALITLGTAGVPASNTMTVQGIEDMQPLTMGSLQTATGGTTREVRGCDLHGNFDGTTINSATVITGVASRRIYICGYIMATGGTATNLSLREGSDANCATNSAALTPVYQLVANDKIGALSGFWTGLAVSANGYYVCVNASAANSHQVEIYYTTQ